jgi:hypothetical protein
MVDKRLALKNLVGDDVAGEILQTSKQLENRAERLGLKHKENQMAQDDLEEFLAAYKAFKAFKDGEDTVEEEVEVEDYDYETEDEAVEEVEEKAMQYDMKALEGAVTRAVKMAFADMRMDDDEEEEKATKKELSALKATNAQLSRTIKELSARVAALEQPISPNAAGYRLTDADPQLSAKALKNGSVNPDSAKALDILGGF